MMAQAPPLTAAQPMNFYVEGKRLRGDEEAGCCRGLTCNGRPCCSRRNWGSCWVALAVLLQLLAALFGFALNDSWLEIRRSFYTGDGYNYTSIEDFNRDGSLRALTTCHVPVSATAPWQTPSGAYAYPFWCSSDTSKNASAVASKYYTNLPRAGVDMGGAQSSLRLRMVFGLLFGLLATLLFCASGPHWPWACGGPGCSFANAAQPDPRTLLSRLKKQNLQLVVGLFTSLVSLALYFSVIGVYSHAVMDPLKRYVTTFAVRSPRGGHGDGYFYGSFTDTDPWNLPPTDPLYGATFRTGPGFDLAVAAGSLGFSALLLMLMFAATCRGKVCCGGPGDLINPSVPPPVATVPPGHPGHPMHGGSGGGYMEGQYPQAIPVAQAVMPYYGQQQHGGPGGFTGYPPPGMMQPGMMQPGMMQPGMMQPGMMGGPGYGYGPSQGQGYPGGGGAPYGGQPGYGPSPPSLYPPMGGAAWQGAPQGGAGMQQGYPPMPSAYGQGQGQGQGGPSSPPGGGGKGEGAAGYWPGPGAPPGGGYSYPPSAKTLD